MVILHLEVRQLTPILLRTAFWKMSYHQQIIVTYEKVVKWRRNLFNVSFGSSGGSFVDELASIIMNFADPEPRPSPKITWKAVGVACHLLLQQPSSFGTASTFSHHLERRLALWKARCIADLVEEAGCIQTIFLISLEPAQVKRM